MKNRIWRFIALRKYRIALMLFDIVFINLAVYLSSLLLKRIQPPGIFYITAIIIWLISASLFLLYSVFRYSVGPIMLAVIAEWIILNLATFYVDTFAIARASLLFMLPLTMIFILGHRLLLKKIRSIRTGKSSKGKRRVLVLGVGEKAKEIARQIKESKAADHEVIGFLNPGYQHERGIAVNSEAVLGKIDNLYTVAKREKIDGVIIAFPAYTPFLHTKIERLMREHSELGLSFKVIPDLHDSLIGRLKINRITGYPLLDIIPEFENSRYLVFKRLMDVSISFLGLIFLLPIMVLIAGALKFYERGPIFYKQERVGESGQPFTLYKFRSMVPNAEKDTGPVWAEENDERVTRFGNFLRRSSLDEIPQLWNVLKGDMSLVGPRPERPHFINNHKELQGKRLNVKPGITGLAQINGRYNLTARQKVKYDYIYLKNCSPTVDAMILLKTIDVVLSKRGVR